MTECRDMLPDLWKEMLKLHWDFLDAEENLDKLEGRKRLELCIIKFLSIVPNDRKFFLPETGMILRQSIMEMENFTAHNAMKGFESISQYANNLCTKPWRKEYRVIKMYSGYFHHEIKKNLVNAEEMFIAMGYRKNPNDVLVLDEPICPDQVANVSRDCMTAYVECSIMKLMKTNISEMKMSATWQDILKVRESITGGTVLSMKALIQHLQLKERREKPSENIYATINHGQVGNVNNVISNCTKCVQPFQYMHANDCAIHQQQPLPPMQPPCNVHHNGFNPYQYPFAHQQIPHSKSLEHYNENGSQFQMPQRHSFDQPNHYETLRNNSHIYETPYDCVDGRHPYNPMMLQQQAYHSPGNRHPLPFSIANQYFQPPSPPPPPPPPKMQDPYYFDRNGYPPQSRNQEFTTKPKSYPPISAEQQFNEFSSSYKKQQQQQQPQNHNKTTSFRNRNSESGSNNINDYLHSLTPSQTQSFKPRKTINKFSDNNHHQQYFLQQPSLPTTGTSTSDSYEEMLNRRRSSRSRNEEGYGSFENWNYVYQSLENNKQQEKQQNGNGVKTSLSQQPAQAQAHQHHPIQDNPKVETPKAANTNTSRVASRVSTSPKVKTWPCSFCTFLNEDKTRICEMCSKTKDFNPPESFNNKPTCV